jgi:outer membrane protein assembly factor BamB
MWAALSTPAVAGGWAHWRGPHGDGVAASSRVPKAISDKTLAWTADVHGKGTPVVDGDLLVVWGFEGEGEALREVLVGLDAADGKQRWRLDFRDFLSDIIYDRYSIGAPTFDGEGNVVLMTSAGDLVRVRRDGTVLWQVPMMELYGRLTFPNGRTGAPFVVDDLVIVHGITSNWGRDGAARDRFQAFDLATGQLVWSSTPGTQPRDYGWGSPVLVDLAGRRTLLAGTGCGHLVALDLATGEPKWRQPIADGGLNVTPVVVGDLAIVAHAVENIGSNKTGGMFAVRIGPEATVVEPDTSPVRQAIVWRNDIDAFSSSGVAVDGVVYQVNQTGDLYAVDAASGAILWQRKLATDQLHGSPMAVGGHLYVPVREGVLHDLSVSRDGATVLGTYKVKGELLGAPSAADGQVFVLSTEGLYAFGKRKVRPEPAAGANEASASGAGGDAVALRVRPAEVILRPGESVPIRVDRLDASGRRIDTVAPGAVTPWIPPTAKVKSTMTATYADGILTAPADAGLTAGAFQVQVDGLIGTFRGRTVSGVPYAQDFEGFARTETDKATGELFGWPPLPWIGARFKWDVRLLDGDQVLSKTVDNPLFQRALVFVGHPDEADYRMEVSVRSDGNARQMSVAGVLHQRYLIALKGNQRVLEISSNQDRLKRSVPFRMEPGVWYRLVSEVHTGADGVAHVRAKAWPAGSPEPEAWTITVDHEDGHRHGAPGLFGFTPQNLHKVHLDDLVVQPLAPEAR